MTENRKKWTAIGIYCGALYLVWALLELVVRQQFSLSDVMRECVLKTTVWIIPAAVLQLKFDAGMHIHKRELWTIRKSAWIVIVVMLLMTGFILGGRVLRHETIAIAETFGIMTVAEAVCIGLGEEMVFRGLFLNAMLAGRESSRANITCVLINAVMFLLMHFPIWITEGVLVLYLTSGAFLQIILLSIVFSYVFLHTRSIWTAALVHCYWDLLLFMLA